MKHQAPSLRFHRSATMPITHTPNRRPGARSSPCNSAGTQIQDIQNEPSPISGHLAASHDQALGHRCAVPVKPRHPRPRSNHQKLSPAVCGQYPQCIQSSRSPDPLGYSIADPARNTSAPTRLNPETSVYQTTPVPFPDTAPPVAADSPRGSVSLPPALCSARKMHDTNRLTSGAV
jgi:hypothetical protein